MIEKQLPVYTWELPGHRGRRAKWRIPAKTGRSRRLSDLGGKISQRGVTLSGVESQYLNRNTKNPGIMEKKKKKKTSKQTRRTVCIPAVKT